MALAKILIVHPKDRSIKFLEPIKKHLINNFNQDVHYFSVKPCPKSHERCLERIRSHPAEGIIIFLGHGVDGVLYGGADNYFKSIEVDSEFRRNYEENYYNDNFINVENIDIFCGKKVFCLACKSKFLIAQNAFAKGAKIFVGFGEIPTSRDEMLYDNRRINNRDIDKIRNEITYIIKRSIEYSIRNNYSFNQLIDILRLITNQRIAHYLQERKEKTIHRHVIADYLYKTKDGIELLGDPDSLILN